MASDDRQQLEELRRLDELQSKAMNSPVSEEKPDKPATFFERFLGSLEAEGSLATNMLASAVSAPVAGLAAAGDIALRKAAGLQEPSPTKDILEKYTLHGYSPRSKEGKQALEMLQTPLTTFEKAMTSLGGKVVDVTGSPALGTLVKTTPDLAMMFAGTKLPKGPLERMRDVSKVEKSAKELGLELGANTTEQAKQLKAAGESFDPAINPSEGMDIIPGAIQKQRAIESGRIGKKYTEAEQMGATLPSRSAGSLSEQLKESVSPFVTEDMKSVNSLLSQAEKFGLPAQISITEALGAKNAAQIPVNDLFEFRKKINANLPSDNRSPEYAALNNMKRTLDGYLNDTLTKDLVTGNPEAIAKWKDAIANWKDFKETFDENKVIRKLQDENATAEQVKNLIFGASAVRAPRQAGAVIDNLKKILGPRSEEFRTLQQSALADVLDPLLQTDPDFTAFVKNYDTFRKNNPTMISKLFNEPTIDKLDSLRNFSKAVEANAPFTTKISDTMKGKGLANAISVLSVGHGIARGSLETSFMRRVLNTLTPDKSGAHRRAIIADVLGYDPQATLLSSKPIARGAAIQSLQEEEQ